MGQKEMKNINFEEEKSTRKLNIVVCARKEAVIFKEISTTKGRPPTLSVHWKGKRDVLRVRPHAVKAPVCESKKPKGFPASEKHIKMAPTVVQESEGPSQVGS